MLVLDWFGISEGATSDWQGKITLTGFNPVLLPLATLPQVLPACLVLLLSTDGPAGTEGPGNLDVAFNIADPKGRIVFAGQQNIGGGKATHPDIPQVLQFVLQVQLNLQSEGAYTASVTVDVGGQDQPLTASRQFWVVPAN